MRLLRTLLVLVIVCGSVCRTAAEQGTHARPTSANGAAPLISILCYHDVSNDPTRIETVSPEFLRAQIQSCKAAGWTFLSLSELLSRRDRLESLPPKVMVMTFDDGYRSFAERALPILRAEGIKATLSIVTGFIDQPPPELPPMLTWDEVRAIDAAGDAEIAAHSDQLHCYETDNPYRDTAPSVTTRRYLLGEARYETRDEYRQRIASDMERSQALLTERLGHPVKLYAWPYGEHNAMAEALAAEAGYSVSLALGSRPVLRSDFESRRLPRLMVTPKIDFSSKQEAWAHPSQPPLRAVQVDIDDLYDPDVAVTRARIDAMIARARTAGANLVFLQACPDPEGNGRMRETWFMNHQTKNHADVWSMIAHKLKHARLEAWIRAPSLNLAWEWERHPEWRIPWTEGRVPGESSPWYFRMSPNLPEARRAAIDFYTDLAVYLPIQGILFDDDAYMLEGEALNGTGNTKSDDKAEAIDGLLSDVRAAVREWRPDCAFARNVYAPVVEKQGVSPRFSQDFARIARDNDLAVVMAYAHMEGHDRDAASWIRSLTRRARSRAESVRKAEPAAVMIKLQSYDWNTKRWVPGSELETLAREARKAGVVNLGVYPLEVDAGEVPERWLIGRADSVASTP